MRILPIKRVRRLDVFCINQWNTNEDLMGGTMLDNIIRKSCDTLVRDPVLVEVIDSVSRTDVCLLYH